MRVASIAAILTVTSLSSLSAQDDRLSSTLDALEWREIGPAIMGGRIADIAAVESDPATFYVGTATGGVWKTTNHGTTWTSLFDGQPTSSIGDVTLAPSNPNVVWVGSGEPQNRQSSPWGNGVYRSTDAGRTWQHLGLTNTHHIARIAVHPNDPDVAYVAAVGHLWGPNAERGVFKTSDGGVTWEHVLFVDEHTGAIDLAMDPGDPETLFAAMYQRRRTGFGFNGGGPGGGIYRTTNGGADWSKLGGGLPEGTVGRIGLDIYRRDGNVVYALVEKDLRGTPANRQRNGVYRSTDRGETWEHLSTTNNRPMYYSQIRVDPNDPDRIYLGGSNLFMSSDGGRTFTDEAAAGVHLDHHALWIDPSNSEHLVLGSDGGVSVSWDRAESWRQLRNIPLAQFYEISVDMRDPYHVCGGLQDNGSWCAPSATWSSLGIRNRDWFNVGSGDGFYTRSDPNDHTIMFAESQGGNLTRVDLATMERARIRPLPEPRAAGDEDHEYRFNWNAPLVVSSHDPSTIYFGGNHVFRSRDRGWTWEEISPDLTKQIDRSELTIMGAREDQMLSRHDGISSYGNLTTLAESPLDAQLLYAGTDDGNVHVTRDGGATWTDLTDRFGGLPDGTYVSRLVPSTHRVGTVYAAFDGHRNDDFAAYVYVSDDYGQRWRPITAGLPDGWSVNTVAEHPRTESLLFVGTEIGLYISADRGARWVRAENGLPTVPVDDIVVHPRDNDLVLGTHGRGIWIMDDIGPLEEVAQGAVAADLHLFRPRRATAFNPYNPQGWTPGVLELPDAPRGALLRYALGTDVPAPVSDENDGDTANDGGDPAHVTITITDASGDVIRTLEGPGTAGAHGLTWDLRYAPPYETGQTGGGGFFGAPRGPTVMPGTYTVRLAAGGGSATAEVEVRGDPRVSIGRADLEARQRALMSGYQLAKPAYDARQAAQRISRHLRETTSLLDDVDNAPESLREEVEAIGESLDAIEDDLGRVTGYTRATFGIEGFTARPTADQLWQLERAWEELPPLIERLNDLITNRVPALNRQLNELGIRPSPGEPVAVPQRRSTP